MVDSDVQYSDGYLIVWLFFSPQTFDLKEAETSNSFLLLEGLKFPAKDDSGNFIFNKRPCNLKILLYHFIAYSEDPNTFLKYIDRVGLKYHL